MKKWIIGAFSMMICLSMAACSMGTQDGQTGSEIPSSAVSSAVAAPSSDAAAEESSAAAPSSETQPGSSSQSSGKLYATVEEYFNTPEIQEQMEEITRQYEGTGISMKVMAEGNKLVYAAAYEDDEIAALISPEDIEASLESQKSTYESIAKMLKAFVDADNPTVEVRYLDSSGNIIYSQEFTA